MNKNDVTLSTTKPSLVGATTKVTIKKEKWACTVNVKNKRQIIAEFECGKPNLKDVKATIYSNGELSFTGNGNIFLIKIMTIHGYLMTKKTIIQSQQLLSKIP